ncbi:hypothetical protein BGX28_000571 [Mortierella sp. GBA30]|nr:hypothetical protein BGX28_000571 [Mortierella sp. GBA30]
MYTGSTKMRSFIRTVTLAAMATFAVVAHAQDGEIIEGFNRLSSNAGQKFQDKGYNALATLAEGPYPQTFSALKSLLPMTTGEGSLAKRQSTCPVGYGDCRNGKCCPTDQLCSVAAGGCCPMTLKYTCGGQYCCPYAYCTSDGHCGCSSASETRCGDKCCYYGCSLSGDCACPSSFPTACSDGQTCCPAGSTCVAGGKCSTGAGGGGGGGGVIPTFSSSPQPTSGSGGSGAGSGSGSGGSGSGGSGSGGLTGVQLPSGSAREYSSGALAAFMAMAVVFAAV